MISLKLDSKKLSNVIILALLMMVLPTAGASPVFTGDVPTDFAVTNVVNITDQGLIDVGVPLAAAPGMISGNDMDDLRIFYDATTDILYIGINTYTIAGDVDDDGDGGTTSAWLSDLGGVDIADFGGSESFSMSLDIDEDGTFDVVAGVSSSTNTSGFSVNEFIYLIPGYFLPSSSYGTELPSHTGGLFGSPEATAPDVEFTILNYSTLPISSGSDPNPLSFGVNVFVGSISDDGIGEDYIPAGEGAMTSVNLASVIGDLVWNDLNEDAIQDPGEPGIGDVTVEIYDCAGNLVNTTTTDADGMYSFTVATGEYYVTFVLPDGMVFSPMYADADDVDSDADTTTGKTVCTTLAPGDDNPTIDAGIYEPEAVIGDYVWNDLNENGVQDAGEPGIEGVTVELYDCAGNLVDTNTTVANGLYSFNVAPGNYSVKFILADGMVFSPANVGDDTTDSDAGPDGTTECTTLAPGETNDTLDAGMYEPEAVIGDYVWNDLNENGVQDADEPGISGLTVELYDCSDVLVDTTTTDINGLYSFTVAAGDYYVKLTLADGMVFSPMDAGADDTLDSDVNTDTGKTVCTTLAPGEDNPTLDAGMYEPEAVIGDLVWNDLNENGVQDADEPGISGLTVELYDCSDVLIGTTTTDTTGMYSFTVALGDYYVKFTLADGMVFSPMNAGTDDAIDSDADTDTGKTVCTTLAPGEDNPTLDAGMYEPEAVIGDLVWNDLNENGVQDADEPGISGLTVELYDCYDVLVDTTTTDTNGLYSFTVAPGDYYVKFTLADGMVFSPMNAGADDAVDSDADTTTGMTECTTLAPGEDNPTLDAGMFEANPAIEIEKSTNGEDADMEPGISLFIGSTVEWTYVVENTGNVVLTNIVVTDDMLGDICTIDSLEPGESHTCIATGIVEPGQYVNIGTGAGEYGGIAVSDEDSSHYYGVNPSGTGTPGYWKNHPEAWPVDEITIGNVIYTKEEAIGFMEMPDGDKTFTIFRALVSAKLNVLIGNDDSCIADTISEADVCMETYGPVGSGIHASSDAWTEGEPLYWELDDYNNGELPCALHRD